MGTFRKWLNESMNLYVQGHNYQSDIHDLDDIANVLKRKILYPAWDKLPEQEQKMIQQGGSTRHGMITPDGSYYSNGTPILNFYTQGWPEELVSKLVQGIKYFLDELRVKYGEFKTNKSGMFDSAVIRIPVLQFSQTENSPPLLNFSNLNAVTIFRDLLGFPEDKSGGGFFNISPADLYRKIEEIEKDLIDIHARDPYVSKQKQGATVYSGGLSSEQINSRLQQIKQIAKWAIDNHYDEIYIT